MNLYHYKIRRLHKVVDGDTYDLEIDLGFYQFAVMRFRLLGVDTPELRSSDPVERDEAKVAQVFVEDWFKTHEGNVFMRSERSDSFGRWLADVYTHATGPNGENESLGDALIAAHLGKEYRR